METDRNRKFQFKSSVFKKKNTITLINGKSDIKMSNKCNKFSSLSNYQISLMSAFMLLEFFIKQLLKILKARFILNEIIPLRIP